MNKLELMYTEITRASKNSAQFCASVLTSIIFAFLKGREFIDRMSNYSRKTALRTVSDFV
jgi:hypothetical protein